MSTTFKEKYKDLLILYSKPWSWNAFNGKDNLCEKNLENAIRNDKSNNPEEMQIYGGDLDMNDLTFDVLDFNINVGTNINRFLNKE